VSRKLFSPDQFIKELKEWGKEKGLDVSKINSRLLLYLVEIGLIYPVRLKKQKYETKKYTQVDLKVVQLLLEELSKTEEISEGKSRRPIKYTVEKFATKIEKENLLEKLRDKDIDETEKLILKEAYKKYLSRVSSLGFKNPEKTDIFGLRRGDHALLMIKQYDEKSKELFFHEILERIVQSAENELIVLITRAKAWDVARGLQKRLKSEKERTRLLLSFEYNYLIRNVRILIKRATRKAKAEQAQTIQERYESSFLETFGKYVQQQAISRGIDLDKIDHIWFINEVSCKFYKAWPEQLNYFHIEDGMESVFKNVLKKNTSVICIYDKEKLFKSILSKNKSLLREVATLIGYHRRIYAFDEFLHTGAQAAEHIMYWIDDFLQNRSKIENDKNLYGLDEKV